MENKPPNKANAPAGDKIAKLNQGAAALKTKINAFLIDYFNLSALGLGAVIFILGLLLFVIPAYSKYADDFAQEKDKLQADLDAKSKYLNTIRSLKKADQLINPDDKAKIAEMVPADGERSAIITEMESLILRNGAVLNSIKLDAQNKVSPEVISDESGTTVKRELPAGIFEKLPAGVGRVKIEINLGMVSYQVLKNIIKTLENNSRLMDIANINFNSKENKAILDIYSYYQVQ